MNRFLAIIILAVLPTIMLAQDIEDKSIEYANTILEKDLSDMLHIISADDYMGRETGYEGQKITEKYLVDKYKELGIEAYNGKYVQNFDVVLKDQRKVYLSMENKQFSFIDDYYYLPPTIDDTSFTSKVMYLGYGIKDEKYDDILDTDISNKVVVIKDDEPMDANANYVISGDYMRSKWSDRNYKMDFLKEKNPSAIFIIRSNYSDNIDRLREYFSHTSMALPSNHASGDKDVPVFYISHNTAEKLFSKCFMKKTTKDEIKFSGRVSKRELNISFKRNSEILQSSNVYAYIEGSDKKDELIVLSAHYDHIGVQDGKTYNGADDDGSGTVAVLEIAEAFKMAKDAGYGPRRSILFLNVSGEEKGLLGSEYYSKHPVFPLENTITNLNIDMIGRVDVAHEDDSSYVYIIGSDMLSTELHKVNEEAQKKYSDIKLDYTYNSKDDPNRFYYRSDHYNFAKNNIPVIFYFTGIHVDYHKPTDTVDKIMFEKLTRITKLIFHTAWELANRDERVGVDVE